MKIRHDKVDFDPFSFNHLFRNLGDKPGYKLGIIGLIMVTMLLIVNVFQGTLGAAQDLRFADDVLVVAGLKEQGDAPTQFPLARDVPSWILLAMIASGAILLVKQWQLMGTCLSRLAKSGALVAREIRMCKNPDGGKSEAVDFKQTFRLDTASRLMGIDRMIRGCSVETALPMLVTKVNQYLTKRHLPLLIFTASAAFVLGGLLGLGQRHSLFIAFAPDFDGSRDPGRESEFWLDAAYSSWWAGADHAAGYLLYGLFAVFGFFIIVSFHTVGFVALYLAIALRYVCRPSADWLNRDGRYGWRALAEVYRTVLLSVAMLGVALTVTLAVLGVRNFAWVGVVVVLYVVLAPAFVLVPRFLFRDVARTAKADRIDALASTVWVEDLHDPSRLSYVAVVVAEMERCRSAKIQPLRLRGASASTLFVFIVLPVLLAALQTFFPWITGLQ